MSAPGERRAHLPIDVEPELHRCIKSAAAARDLSVWAYAEAILRQALEAEAQGEDTAEQVVCWAISLSKV